MTDSLSSIFVKIIYNKTEGSTKKASDVAIAAKYVMRLLRHFSNLSVTYLL